MNLLEVQTDPEWASDSTGTTVSYTWRSKMTVDLHWVATARPYWDDQTTVIQMAGSTRETPINISYGDFMVMWMQAKGIPNWSVE